MTNLDYYRHGHASLTAASGIMAAEFRKEEDKGGNSARK
jgi:hypothetical protein